MKKIYILILLVILFSSGVRAQDYSTLHATRDTPQANLLNPAYLPESSFLTIPALGNSAFRVTNSFSLDAVIDDRVLDVSEIPDGSELNLGFNLNFINFGIYIDDKSMITFSSGIKTNIDFMYPTGAFDLIVDDEIQELDSFDVDFKSSATVWGEVAVGYTRAINNNWSVGAKLKYLVGVIGGTSNNTKFKIDKTIHDYTIQGDVDVLIGGYDTSTEDMNPEDLASNAGLATDLGVYYRSDDNRYSIGLSVLDLGYINWNSGSHIVSKYPDKVYRVNDFEFIDHIINNNGLSSLTDKIYDDMLDAIEMDTLNVSFSRMLPTTINLEGSYRIDPLGQHIITGSFLSRIYAGQGYDYCLTAGYSYSPKGKKIRFMGSLANRKHDPLSIGLGLMCASDGFQFYVMSDVSVGTLLNVGTQRGLGLGIGMNILLGRRRLSE